MSNRLAQITTAIVTAVMLFEVSTLHAKDPPGKKRARPPKWSDDVLDTFYPDARQKLVGARPNFEQVVAVVNGKTENVPAAQANSAASGWSKLIDAETIETEIKRVGPELAKAAATPSGFKGGGYKDCRRLFSVLAAMFAVNAEYDGDVRWHDAAPGLRDAFARAGYNCKAGSDQTFQEAALRKQDLVDLVAGNRPKSSKAEPRADWSKVADRPPLMQRMEIAHEERLKKWLASKSEFTAHQADVRHEAQLVATIADIIGREGFEYWDDEQYSAYARDLRQAAADVSAAAESGNFGQAQQAGNRMTKACADCHDGYRG